jgi:hypothetical protein
MTDNDFDELVGDVLEPGERARLRRTHALLVTAGPPPELPPTLRAPPGSPPAAEVVEFPRGFPGRRWAAYGIAAAALAIAAFGGGYLVAHEGTQEAFAVDFVLPMRGTAAAPQAHASLEVGVIDDAGNWPMRMTLRGLPERPNRGRYELSLTQKGRIAASCGVFTVHGQKTVVFLNAPYRLRQYDDWVVTVAGSSRILMTSSSPDARPDTTEASAAAAFRR